MSEQDPGAHASGEFVGESGDTDSRNLQQKQELGPSVAARLPSPEINALQDTPCEDGDGNHGNGHPIKAMFVREMNDHLRRCKDAKNSAGDQKKRYKPRAVPDGSVFHIDDFRKNTARVRKVSILTAVV